MYDMDRKKASLNNTYFSLFWKQDMVLPALDDIAFSKSVVPLRFRISRDRKVHDIEFDDSPRLRPDFLRINDLPAFVAEAKRLVNAYDRWIYFNPYPIGETKTQSLMKIDIHFLYSTAYFEGDETFVLHPEVKAVYPEESPKYNRIVLGENGFDGVIDSIFVVEPDGEVSHFECLSALGKTNCEIGESYLRELGKWEPATHEGKKVRSQKVMTIHT